MKTSLLVLIPCVWCVGVAGADVVDLTAPNSSGTINGVLFSTAAPHAAGSGFIDSFLRVQRNGTESGYNTSIPSQQFGRDEVAGNFTHDIRLGDVARVTVEGNEYYQFFLDINESNGGSNNLLSLDDVQIFTSTTAATEYHMNLSELGTQRYSMDMGGDSRVELDYALNPQLQGPGGGSGTGDMVMLVPVGVFGTATAEDFVYLYSAFGASHASDAGFEEWWTREAVVIPLPPAGLAGVATLAGFAMLRRAKGRREGRDRFGR